MKKQLLWKNYLMNSEPSKLQNWRFTEN